MLGRPHNYLIGNATRISIGLLFIVLTALGVSYTVGLLPSHDNERAQRQLDVARSLAVQFSVAIESGDVKHLQELAGSTLGSIPDIVSIGLRKADGKLIFASADHATLWKDVETAARQGTARPIKVILLNNDKTWGQLELNFRTEPTSFRTGTIGLVIFVGLACLLGFLLFMKRTLRVLDPSQVIPERVRLMLDTLAEGAAIVDSEGRIVLANQSLAETLSTTADQLLGARLGSFPWIAAANASDGAEADAKTGGLPWAEITGDVNCRGRMVQLQTPAGPRSLVVNASSIQGGRGQVRGFLFTFDDVSTVERKNQQLAQMVDQLGQAQEHVQQQNEELRRLATRDPLTDCLNRRTFHEQIDTLFALAKRQQQPLAVIMVDIDHFKAVNDNYGHARGDDVLRGIAKTLRGQARASDVVCRYGGEEFCILLPATDLAGAAGVAEKLRAAIACESIAELKVTASLGVSCTALGAETVPVLIDQADQALYNSKRSGRDRVTRFDRLDPTVPPKFAERETREQATDEHIPVHAVHSLLAALSFRDPHTAEHSRRVAELCVKAGAAWLNACELYILETAALLHDIGKVGVPDSVLLKPGPLTEDEWRIMHQHDRIGVEIIQTAFNCPQLASIIAFHHARHEANGDMRKVAKGEFVPICARLLAIADAFDAMTTHRVYREASARDVAFAELRRFAGTQFDPLLVEHFINVVSETANSESTEQRTQQLARVLRLGMEAEMTATALLNKDMESTVALASHLAQVAAAMGSDELAQRCRGIVSSIESAADLQTLLAEVQGLLRAANDRSDPRDRKVLPSAPART